MSIFQWPIRKTKAPINSCNQLVYYFYPQSILILEECLQKWQWSNVTLARRFWATKVCLLVSKISKICLFGCPTGRATSWKANFENFSKYYLVKWYQVLSIQHSMIDTSFRFRHTFLLSARSSQSHTTSCSSLMSHYWVTSKCDRVKGRC